MGPCYRLESPMEFSFRNVRVFAAVGVAVLMSASNISHAGQITTGAAILQELRSFATMASVLYVEAFRFPADPTAFPEKLGDLKPWQARRIVHNVGRGVTAANPVAGTPIAGLPADVPDGPGVVKIDAGGRDPASGESFASIAARSRGMHKTQGFDVSSPPFNDGPRIEPFVLLAGDMPTRDLFDGVDTTWARFPGGGDVARSIDAAIASF